MTYRFDLGDLQAFAAVANLGSFHAAAKSLHLSQPALSRRVDKLELALGVKLLERTTRRVSLSTVGREFFRSVQKLMDELSNAVTAVEENALARTGTVTIASVPSATRNFLPEVLLRFHQRYPRIRVRILDDHANVVLQTVLQGDADFGISFLGKNEALLRFVPLLNERFVLACHKDHPFARKAHVRWSELSDQSVLAVDKNSGNRLLIDQAMAAHGQQLNPSFEARHVQTVLGLVEAGLGVAAVPQLAMPTGNTSLVAIRLIGPVVKREMGLIQRRGHQLNGAAADLYSFIATPN
jgi:DNA-binding transcriptional LysR family regulator